jgi:hypothetical protein
MATGRAGAGGQIGMNGEHYDGGQFLPSSPFTVKGENKTTRQAGSRKVEIAPCVWEVAPEGKQTIFHLAGVVLKWKVFRTELEATNNAQALNYYGYTQQEAQALADRWNAGERYI